MITACCCTFNRHALLERVVRFYLDQEYSGESTLLIYNNSPAKLEMFLQDVPENKHIILINNHLDLQTGQLYTNVGDIFRDALTFVPKETDILTFYDDDDVYLPNHLEEGAKGMKRAIEEGKLAYKPYFSYFFYYGKIQLANNNMEPSIFVDYDYVRKTGFNTTPVSYHQKWLIPLQEQGKILEDKKGVPTLIYDWGSGMGAFKMSGGGDTDVNFHNHKRSSVDVGDGLISPWTKDKIDKFWGTINSLINASK